MFKHKHFYHSHIRKAIIAFGQLFNNIQIRRTNSEGEIVQSLFVPLSYAPKQKFIARIRDVPEVDANRLGVELTLPRIGFEITNINYDPSRKLAITQTVRSIDVKANDNGIRYSYVATPYNIGIGMSVFAKNQDDALQIVEQIFPYFNPDFNVTINEIPDLGVKRDLQIVLDSVNYNDEWEGSFDKRLSVIWDFSFTMKLNFYGYVDNANIIKKSIQNVYADYGMKEFNPVTNTLVGERITSTIDPITAKPTDNYQYITEFDEIYSTEL